MAQTHPCLGKQLNPHAIPYLRTPETGLPLLCYPPSEVSSIQSPPVTSFPNCFNCTTSTIVYQQSCASFPVWVQTLPPLQFTRVFYSLPPIYAVQASSPSDIPKKPRATAGEVRKLSFGWKRAAKTKGRKESWIPKGGCGNVLRNDGSDSGELKGETSLMIKNIPNQLRRSDLIQILDEHCAEENMKANSDQHLFSEYDFLYLPMDFARHANLGYAFVNFTTEVAAKRFWESFNGYKWQVAENKKTCEVNKALIQGKDAFMKHFKNSVFPCHSNSYLPVTFSPPRNGSAQCRPTVVGKRVAREASGRK